MVFAYDLDPGDPDVVRLRHLVGKGIAYHHAGLLPALKEIVEVLFTEGHIRVLFATETFALGVNMPARAVAFEGLTKWNGVSRVALKTREFQQMAGRAGRRGIDTRGDVFVTFDPSREDARVLESVLRGQVEPIESQFNLSYSTLLNLYSRLGDRIYAACARSFAHWRSSRGVQVPPRELEAAVARVHEQRARERAEPARRQDWGEDRGDGDFDRRSRRKKPKGGGGGRRSRPGRAEREEARRNKHPERERFRESRPSPPPRPAAAFGSARYDDMVEQVDRKLEVLRELGYLDGLNLTPKGRFASLVYGHELETTELVFEGVFDRLNAAQVACVAASVVHESRRESALGGVDPKRALGESWRTASKAVRTLYDRELEHGVRYPVKLLDWKLTGAVWAWANGAEFAELRDFTDASDGDIVRSLRQAIQLMRLVHKPLVELARGDLVSRFQGALGAVKRGLVDAEWQLRRAAELEAERLDEEKRGISHLAPVDLSDQPIDEAEDDGEDAGPIDDSEE
jgi:superfamily II RNA helicase